MAARYIESVADDAAFDALCAALPGKAGIAYQVDVAALCIKSPGGTKVEIPVTALGVTGVAAGYKIARGQHTTLDADDTVVTGLTTVVAAVANLESDPVLTCDRAQAVIGDQAGAPAAGSIQIKTFMPTGAGDATPVPATTFTKLVNWIAIGT